MSLAEFHEAIGRSARLLSHPKAEDLDELLSTAAPDDVVDAVSKMVLQLASML